MLIWKKFLPASGQIEIFVIASKNNIFSESIHIFKLAHLLSSSGWARDPYVFCLKKMSIVQPIMDSRRSLPRGIRGGKGQTGSG
ncbi:hypothetical protein COX69_00390 [Candidatus Falkowbacteria bacterium CG_4_10_14_0_2_um_filter_48_10]|uniref:Uncharacterized protein n=1 Tax=Candidatus Falkowbacteria bacterium CG23_combo_of_CG06-09_8_20_14_all_49_15 TaxID=1974572 RepID=A0A2G9ZJZ3_9BACT|nr:MAG: hypothetical protein COX22_04040 [Candidatus Falkowbacteria bacterium CG23_combo_of_CG06-09_8_20_14_all_49_15]PJA09281.1 MAG: hypothetical protein COX69_00390 [Candidatus Falkowbacteria bacterium CG_4_10_14_0_2_um_filter_48_10]